MRTVMTNRFSTIPDVTIPRSKFNRSHGLKTTFNMGYLVPIFVDEALPGDTFNLRMSCFGRLATPIVPIMDNIYMDIFYFAVPVRLVWSNWQKFNGEQVDPGDSIDYTVPVLDITEEPSLSGFVALSLDDYLGLPTEVPEIPGVSSLWHRSYNLIWNEWFRDQNLQDSVTVDKDDGPDDGGEYVLLKRGKRHDYFTSALPWPQKGDSVELPLGDTAPVQRDGASSYLSIPSSTYGYLKSVNATSEIKISDTWQSEATLQWGSAAIADATGLETDLSTATAATINELRQAFQVQRLLERDARGGTRYTEIIRSHFGVTSPDARLQRPEYLGGGRMPINIHPVTQTSQTDTTPQGTMAAMGTLSASGVGFSKSFTEHCLLLGLACVTADLTYQEGLPRQFSRSTRYDFFWPTLSNIGEQAVLNKEIYCQGSGNLAEDAAAFGYQERYAEYRYKPSVITGQFRSNHATSLDVWHMAQEFGALPTLNTTFIQETPPTRFLATPGEPHIIFDSYNELICARCMPTYSVPGMIDHF